MGDCLKFPGKLGIVKAIIHRPLDGELKTVTVSKTPSGKYYASVLMEYEGASVESCTSGKVIGIDLGIKDFAICYDGEKTSKFSNPKHLAKSEKKLAKKQRIAARKKKRCSAVLGRQRGLGGSPHERLPWFPP